MLGLLAVLAILAPTARAVDFTAGGSASLVLGAPDFVTAVKGSATRMGYGFDTPTSVHYDTTNARFYVADAGNSRVASFSGIPTADGAPMDWALRQSSTADYRDDCTQAGGRGASDIATGGGRAVVAEESGRRVLLYNAAPTASTALPDVVLGQGGFTSCGWPSTPSASNLYDPRAAWTNGTKVIVADTDHNRVLIWNSWPTTNGQAADLVLGQPNFTSDAVNAGGRSASTMYYPFDVWSDGTRILVADRFNGRVLVWNSWPTTNGQTASLVLGQDTATTYYSGCESGFDSRRLNEPMGVWSDGTKVIVTDRDQSRALIYNSWPTVNLPTPDRILGQTSATACQQNRGGAVGAGTLASPSQLWSNGTSTIAIADTLNRRVLIWTSWPAADGAAANRVLGHTAFTAAGPLDMGLNSVFGQTFWTNDYPEYLSGVGLYSEGGTWPAVAPSGSLWLSSSMGSRVTAHTTAPTTNNEDPTWLFGQAAATDAHCNGSGGIVTSTSVCGPHGVWTDGTRLIVADTANHRVKIWNAYPTSANEAPSLVLGQADFTSSASGTTATTMSRPYDVASDGTRIAVTDFGNNRVLIWNSWPTTNGQAADLVLGQPGFTSSTRDNGGLSASSMDGPTGVAMWNGALAVADQYNGRVLLWGAFPTTSNEAATGLFGKSSFTATAGGITTPKGVELDANALMVTDSCSALYLDPMPTTTIVESTTQRIAPGCYGTPSASRIDTPIGIDAHAGTVWVDDAGHARLLRFQDTIVPTITSGPTVTFSCGTPTVSWNTSESTTTEVYYGQTSQASYTGYTSSYVDSNYTGLGHSRALSGLAPGTWYYRVRGVDWAGSEVVSAESTFTVGGPVVTDNQAGDDTWRRTNSGLYDVDVCGTRTLTSLDTRAWTAIGQTGTMLQDWTQAVALSGTSYTTNWPLAATTWSALQEGTNHITVRATDSATQTTVVDAFYVKKDTVPPPDVTTLSATSPTSTSPVLSWTTVTDATSGTAYYRVYRSTSSGTLGTQINADGATTTGSYTDTTAVSGTKYYYTVRAVDVAGNANASTSQVGVNYSSGLTLTVDATSKSATASVDANTTLRSVVSIDTDSAAGYTLTATDASDSWGMEQATVDTLPDWTGTNAAPTSWAAGTAGYFGVTVLCVNAGSPCTSAGAKDTSRWGTGYGEADFASLSYVGLRTTSTALHATGSKPAGTETVTTSYRMNFSINELAGTYSTTVAYTAVANP